ncbi:MAG: hypothetical protein A2580_09750 [Hydrogenophilales bacterium RIFOXYD1_FULL_62_11]|nr:MAG: hypothetical protein A2580_09750 [Hydrogenophilales bacterium RIFOXYD1_FULL_62_11]
MSVINQMLRELDARGAGVSNAPAVPVPASVNRRVRGLPVAAGLLVLAALGALGYGLGKGAPDQSLPPVLAAPKPLLLDPLPVARTSVPPVAQEAPQSVPLPSSPSVPPAAVPEMQNPPVLPSIRMAMSLAVDPSQPALKASTSGQPSQVLPVQPNPLDTDAGKATVIKKVIALSPEEEAQRLQDESQSLRRAGKLEAAVAKYQQALARHPGMSGVRLQLAEMLLETGSSEAALQVLQAGYAYQPNDTLAIASGRMLAELGRRDEALDWLARARTGLRPADRALMGALLAQVQRYEESVKAYQRALVADPDRGGWLLGLGVSLESLGRTEEARAAYQKALQRGEFKPEVIEFLRKKTGELGL